MTSGSSLEEKKFEKVEVTTKEITKKKAIIRHVNPQDDGPSTPKSKPIFSVEKTGNSVKTDGSVGSTGIENKNKYDTSIKGWMPLQCDPNILTSFSADLGFQEVYSFTEV